MTESRAERRRAARIARAEATRKRALSPLRILLRLAFVPVLAAGVALSVYIRTSEHSRQDALRHLVALAGCEAAAAVGLAPAREGRLGYHPRNDPDGDGIACPGIAMTAQHPVQLRGTEPATPDVRIQGGAKFVRP